MPGDFLANVHEGPTTETATAIAFDPPTVLSTLNIVTEWPTTSSDADDHPLPTSTSLSSVILITPSESSVETTPSTTQSDVVETTISTPARASTGPHEESSQTTMEQSPSPTSTLFPASESGDMPNLTSSAPSSTESTESSDSGNGSMPVTGAFSLRTCLVMLSLSVIILGRM